MNAKSFFSADNIRMATFLFLLIGAMWTLSSNLENRLTQRIDRLEDTMNNRFKEIDDRLNKIDTRLDSFGERIAKNEARINASE
ncbi:MAG: hypothetical protein J4F39_13900 [Candidatus Latescibacteria bacterium]|nr:hypothetical protein [Candidatus Latescibacterota bacterium]